MLFIFDERERERGGEIEWEAIQKSELLLAACSNYYPHPAQTTPAFFVVYKLWKPLKRLLKDFSDFILFTLREKKNETHTHIHLCMQQFSKRVKSFNFF